MQSLLLVCTQFRTVRFWTIIATTAITTKCIASTATTRLNNTTTPPFMQATSPGRFDVADAERCKAGLILCSYYSDYHPEYFATLSSDLVDGPGASAKEQNRLQQIGQDLDDSQARKLVLEPGDTGETPLPPPQSHRIA